MKKEKEKICPICGQKIEGEAVEIDGESVCQDCFDEYYFYCEDCGKVEKRDNGYWIKDKEILVCESCANNNYYCCQDCGDWFEDVTYVERHGYVCEDCLEYNDYGYCDNCGCYYPSDYIQYNEHQDRYYCDDCWSECCDDDNYLLYDYHEFNDWQLFKGEKEIEAPYYIGKEIELEPKNNYCLEEVVEIMNRYINGVGMEDGSLNSGGIEVVTHPESWQYLLEHKENYKKFFEEMEHLQYGDAGHTGLHFHVSRPNENVISRVIVLIESFKEEIKKLSRRGNDFHWCSFMSDNESNKNEKVKYQSTKYLKDKYINSYHDRYVALNLQNSKTIEFRFFNGANNFEEFWGALQFIHNIMELALDEQRDLNTINWQDLINGEELINQATKQDVLNVDKYAKDTTEIVEKIEKIKEDTKEEIRNTLKNFIRYITRQMENKRLEILNRNDVIEIENNSKDFVSGLCNDLNYLQNITYLYKTIENNSIESIKNTASRYKNDKYDRYFKQIDKAIKNYESEVNE